MSEYIPKDTTLEAYRAQIQALRRLGPEGRLRMMAALNQGVRRTIEAGIRHRHPDYNDRQIKLARIKLMVGKEVFNNLIPGIEIEP
jgi:hypothetical protein